MKHLIALFLFLTTCLLHAQDYQAICRPGTTFFMSPDSTQKAFRIAQTVALAGGDTVFYTYPAIRDSVSVMFGTCRDTTAGDALGRRIHKRSNGWFYFFNVDRDTVAINTQAGLNESWRFCALPGGGYIEATVTGIGSGPVINTTDMVKTITLQTKNAAGSNIAGIFNGKMVRLSKLYGLTECWDFYKVPYDTAGLKLHVLTHPPMGPQPYGWREVYDYAVGDEFHYHASDNFGSGAVVIRTIDQIIGKTDYGDSVTYSVSRCMKRIYPVPPPNTFTSHDTVILTYNFITLAGDPRIGLLPDEFIHLADPYYVPRAARMAGKYNGREVQECNDNAFAREGNCYTDPFESFGPLFRYAPGLGEVHYEKFIADITMLAFQHDLVYFRKGTETWGQPVAADCEALLTGFDNHPDVTELSVTPNPAAGDITVTLRSTTTVDHSRYSLFSADGRLVGSGFAKGPAFVVSRSGLASGVYVIILRDESGGILGRARVVWL